MSNAHYWINKEERAKKAIQHEKDMNNKYSKQIQDSIKSTVVYDRTIQTKTTYNKNITMDIIDTDSVSAVLNAHGKTCVLNFASFKNPGGMFIKGSKAQEECLCHESTLYNVLKEFDSTYYAYNKQNLNKALYLDRALYSPNIIFERDTITKSADVLTCAAPNYSAANKYCNVDKITNSNILRQRIRFILSIINEHNLDTVILGAYGCGVFGQDPTEVATIFIEEIEKIINKDIHIIFAVIDKDSDNYKAFNKIIRKEH